MLDPEAVRQACDVVQVVEPVVGVFGGQGVGHGERVQPGDVQIASRGRDETLTGSPHSRARFARFRSWTPV